MATTRFTSVDDYIAAQPESAQAVLQRVRSAIRRALPKADEAISYQIPTFTLQGKAVLYFAGWKTHYSIYPANGRLVAAFRKDLEPYEVNDKGTIRFPLGGRVPVTLIQKIARFRAEEVTTPSAVTSRRRA